MKTYYAQLKKPVLKHVKAYRDDFIVTDKKLLRNYHGSFVHASRETGTDIALFENIKDHAQDSLSSIALWLFKYNTKFFIGDQGVVKEVLKQEAEEMFQTFKQERLKENGE